MKATHQGKMLVCSFQVDRVTRYEGKRKMMTAGLYQVLCHENGFVGVDTEKLDDCNDGTYAMTAKSRLPITEVYQGLQSHQVYQGWEVCRLNTAGIHKKI